VKQLPQHYKTASNDMLIELEINHRMQVRQHDSLAALIRRELKQRKKREKQ